MKIDLVGLSKVYLEHLQRAKSGDGAPCPSDERLVNCVMGDVSKKERAEIVGHAASCVECAAALKQLLALGRETDRAAADLYVRMQAGQTNGAQSTGGRRTRPFLVPAVAVLSVMLVGVVLIVSVPKLLNRSATRGVAKQSVILLSPAKGEAMQAGAEFKWQAVAGADRYRVEVFDKSFRLVWRSGSVKGTSVGLQPDGASSIVPGEAYYWMVTALADGRADVKSTLSEFSVTR
jgi:hypothetical protein